MKAGEEVTINLKTDEGAHGFDIEGIDASITEPNGTVTFTPTEAGEFLLSVTFSVVQDMRLVKSTLVVIK